MELLLSRLATPVGPLLLVGDEAGTLHGVFFADGRRPPLDGVRETDAPLQAVRDQLDAWFAGARHAFDVPVAPAPTPHQRRVRAAVEAIPYGTTRTYGDVARELGTGPRAVGLANGRNPLTIVVPCHRLVGAGGALTGYGGGLERKRRLLEHERAHAKLTM